MNRKSIISCLCLAALVLLLLAGCKAGEDKHSRPVSDDQAEVPAAMHKITININGTVYPATLEDNQAARELMERMPFTAVMEEHNGNEKFYNFQEALTADAEDVGTINNGDLMLFGSDCLVVFYESFDTPYAYTRLGRIDNPQKLAQSLGQGSVEVTFDIDRAE